KSAQSIRNVAGRDAELTAGSYAGERVQNNVPARYLDANCAGIASLDANMKNGMSVIDFVPARTHVVRGAKSKGCYGSLKSGKDAANALVVPARHHGTARRHATRKTAKSLVKLGLRPVVIEMIVVDVGYDRNIRMKQI